MPNGNLTQFQSTPPRGGRRLARLNETLAKMFQSTPPRGGRPGARLLLEGRLTVSIHAPARGATAALQEQQSKTLKFQSTPPRGGRRSRADAVDDARCFNPRPRAGGDGFLPGGGVLLQGFNPRPRAGGDVSRACGRRAETVSIHAPARGATRDVVAGKVARLFQSTPPRGGRRWCCRR